MRPRSTYSSVVAWLVRTVGSALMSAMLVPLAGWVISLFVGDGVFLLALVLAPFVFAWRLMGAEAPFTIEAVDDRPLAEQPLTADE